MDSAPYFSEVFRRFTEWLEERKLGSTHRFSIATDWYVPGSCVYLVTQLSDVAVSAFPFSLSQSLGH